MQHGTKNGNVGILFWLEPGAKITCHGRHFFGTGGRTIHGRGYHSCDFARQARQGQGLAHPFLRRMILRLAVLLCASGAAAALLPTPLRASPHRHTRARKLVATEFGFLETVKEKMTQLTDLRICRASHILVKGNDTATLERIAEWKREIGNDEELFAKFATEHSTCPSRTRGGDLGYFPRGKMARRPANIRRPRALCHAGALSCLGRLCLGRL